MQELRGQLSDRHVTFFTNKTELSRKNYNKLFIPFFLNLTLEAILFHLISLFRFHFNPSLVMLAVAPFPSSCFYLCGDQTHFQWSWNFMLEWGFYDKLLTLCRCCRVESWMRTETLVDDKSLTDFRVGIDNRRI